MEEYDFNYHPDYRIEELNEYEIVKRFKTNSIMRERIEIYHDFTINLLCYIHDTYFGREYIKTDEDIIGHFNWCYNKVVEEFEDEEIFFRNNDELYKYFFAYYYDQFYCNKNGPDSISTYLTFWNTVFDYGNNKKKKTFDLLIEIYKVFDQSFAIEEKELEIA